jgi:alpha-beta hydrolase superfamily lysophospholipase
MNPPVHRSPQARSGPWRRPLLLLAVLLLAAARPPATPPGFHPELPAPTGPMPVGTSALHLVDAARQDPWRPGLSRELMVQLWYPAARPGPPAPYVGPAVAKVLARGWGFPEGAVTGLRGHATADAPLDRTRGRLPVVLFSPGDGGNRRDNTALTEDLASRGYLVAAVDHLGDGSAGELPHGRVVGRSKPSGDTEAEILRHYGRDVAVRVADTRLVLDTLAALHGGRRPAGLLHPPGPRLAGALDLDRVGAFGHSLGGATTAEAMFEDRRILAGADLDGLVVDKVKTRGLDRPFLILRQPGHTTSFDPTWKSFLPALRGWHRIVAIAESGHYSFADLGLWAKDAGIRRRTTPEQWKLNFGDVDGGRAAELTREALAAFFDHHLRGTPLAPILRGPDPRYQELDFGL